MKVIWLIKLKNFSSLVDKPSSDPIGNFINSILTDKKLDEFKDLYVKTFNLKEAKVIEEKVASVKKSLLRATFEWTVIEKFIAIQLSSNEQLQRLAEYTQIGGNVYGLLHEVTSRQTDEVLNPLSSFLGDDISGSISFYLRGEEIDDVTHSTPIAPPDFFHNLKVLATDEEYINVHLANKSDNASDKSKVTASAVWIKNFTDGKFHSFPFDTRLIIETNKGKGKDNFARLVDQIGDTNRILKEIKAQCDDKNGVFKAPTLDYNGVDANTLMESITGPDFVAAMKDSDKIETVLKVIKKRIGELKKEFSNAETQMTKIEKQLSDIFNLLKKEIEGNKNDDNGERVETALRYTKEAFTLVSTVTKESLALLKVAAINFDVVTNLAFKLPINLVSFKIRLGRDLASLSGGVFES